MNFEHVVEIAVPLFLILDPLGNLPLCLSQVREHTASRQRRILMREALFALGFMIFFLYMGNIVLGFLSIQPSTLRIAGGIILFLISINMVFPQEKSMLSDSAEKDPFIVPIAVPLLAGPSLLAAIMLFSHREGASMEVVAGVVLAWACAATIIVSGATLARIIGAKGLRAMERLMGLILILLSVQMLQDGVKMFIESL